MNMCVHFVTNTALLFRLICATDLNKNTELNFQLQAMHGSLEWIEKAEILFIDTGDKKTVFVSQLYRY